MSNPHHDTASNGINAPVEAAHAHPTLPTFLAVREHSGRRSSVAESSTSQSLQRAADFQKRSRSRLRESWSESNRESHHGRSSPDSARKRQNRTSTGFLLDPVGTPSRLSKIFHTNSLRKHDDKGKRKSTHSDLAAGKRRRDETLPHGRAAAATPPISTRTASERGSSQYGASSVDGSPASLRVSYGNAAERPANPTSIGFDTDPAQIVDMALRLSEGRRRQASGNRYVSGDASSPRVVNTTVINGSHQSPAQGPNIPSSPIAHATPSKRPISRDITTPALHKDPHHDSRDHTEPDGERHFNVSRATAARVEKAKIYIELAHQHRRLLAHLPPLLPPDQQTPLDGEMIESKGYNPLQYARNRKLRMRERSGLQAEKEGWHDVDAVRAWVDAVADSHKGTQYQPTECVRLPPLSLETQDEKAKASDTPTSPQTNQPVVRARRPKSDWVTHPADLLADAYWLEQGMNKIKIQDRENRHIFPSDTQFTYAGWRRNAAPVQIPEALQEPTPPPEEGPSQSAPTPGLASAPELPSFRSAHRGPKQDGRLHRGRRTLVEEARKSKRRAFGLLDSSSDSSSTISESDSDNDQVRGRAHSNLNSNLPRFDLPDGDPFGEAVRVKPNEGKRPSIFRLGDSNSSNKERLNGDENRLLKYLKRDSIHRGSAGDRDASNTHDDNVVNPSPPSEDQSRSSAEYDISRPSPSTVGPPRIAINSSPSHSRSSSVVEKARHSILPMIKEKRGDKPQTQDNTSDFAGRGFRTHSRDTSTDVERSQHSNHDSRGTSPMNTSRRDQSPQHEPTTVRLEHRSSTISGLSSKSGATDHPRIRGRFKGGRIAELVGHEVSRVGDFIWKRDPPTSHRDPMSASAASLSSHTSDTDDADGQNGHAYKTPPRNVHTSGSATSVRGEQRRSQESPRAEPTPKLHNPNLPSFISPFQRDRDRQEKKDGLLTPGTPGREADHISSQAAQHRSRSKSPRFDRLAPPKLDTSGGGNGGSPETKRMNSYGFGTELDLTGSKNASQAYNDAIGRSAEQDGTPVTGSTTDLSHHIRKSVAHLAQPNAAQTVRKQDIVRVEALLLMSATQARAILSDSTFGPPPSERAIKIWHSRTQDIRLSQCESNVTAARSIISRLANHHTQFDSKLHDFSNSTIGNLHSELQILEDTIENELTPRVRTAADHAGELGIKLSTSSTLAVKSLNDLISEAFRLRRRGPFRWLRQFGYSAIAWAVVALLWIIWATVTSLKMFLGIFAALFNFIRWMLWLR